MPFDFDIDPLRGHIRISAENKPLALIEICRRWDELRVRTLEEALEALDVYVETDDDGNIVGLEMETHSNMYDLEELVNCLSPSVDSGSYLVFVDDELEVFRYLFEDGRWAEDYVGNYHDVLGHGEDDHPGEQGEDQQPAVGPIITGPGIRGKMPTILEW